MTRMMKTPFVALAIVLLAACSDAPDTGLDTQLDEVRSAVVQLASNADGVTIAVIATDVLKKQLFGWQLAEGVSLDDYQIRVVEAVDRANLPVPESLLPGAVMR
jgi:uncharacterized lipoprotein YajG